MPALLLLFIVVPLVELTLLFRLADVIGGGATVLLVILTGIVGSHLVRRQGTEVLRLIQSDLQEGKMPADRIFSGLLILLGGAFLITPGVLTDVVGFLLMVPGNRRFIISRLKERVQTRLDRGMGGQPFFHFHTFQSGQDRDPFDHQGPQIPGA
ncbi:MAG: FxsA family protein [Planctomycetota bacterium]|jgi:UPF0716 protein FxsA